MRHREVARLMGGRGAEQTVSAVGGSYSASTYEIRGQSIYVEYDRLASRRAAEVVLVTETLGDEATEFSVLETSLTSRYGEPAAGHENLRTGLLRGDAVWLDEACGVRLTAFHRPRGWWQESGPSLFLKLEALGPDEGVLPANVEPAAPEDAGLVGDEPLREVTTAAEPEAEAASAARPVAVPVSNHVPPEPAVISPETVTLATDETQALATARTTEPELLPDAYVQPAYPRILRRHRVTGSVKLSMVVKVDGTVGSIRVVESTRPGVGFEEAALKAIRQWRYRPALRDGVPTVSMKTVLIRFE